MATVLVVDDEPIVREVVVRYLERDGHHAVEAGDADSAARPSTGMRRAWSCST
jgi:CheY-like chemotaxis protein